MNSGASGCPVIDLGSNAVVGMISSQTGEYSNMTICIPITTINNIIETADFNDVNNYDDEAYQFLNISTEILTPTIINSVYQYVAIDEEGKVRGEVVTGTHPEPIQVMMNYYHLISF